MPTVVEAVIPTADGMFLLLDLEADNRDARRQVMAVSRMAGNRGGRMYAVSAGILLVRCADQYSQPWLGVEPLRAQPDREGPWQWEQRLTLELPSGRLRVDAGDVALPQGLLDIDLGTGSGGYHVVIGHVGRAEMRQSARRVREQTLHATVEDTMAAWRRLDGLERYLIRLWPRR